MIVPPFPADISLACTLPEAVDNYLGHEWALVYLTGVLCLATVGLMIYTAGLYRATVKLSRDAEASADIQRADTLRALIASEKTAESAKRSTEISLQSMTSSQRAFVFWRGFRFSYSSQNDKLAEYVIYADLENLGITPAMNVRMEVRIIAYPSDVEGIPFFDPKIGNTITTVLGPKMSHSAGQIPLSVDQLVDCFDGKINITIWSRVEYNDIFSPHIQHHHEQSAKFHLLRDPSTMPDGDHPPYLQFHTVGEQNTFS